MAETEYIALKRMKVQEVDEAGEPVLGENGRPILRQVGPGEVIPEAGSWSNLYKEVRAGRVGFAGTPLAGPALADAHRQKLARQKPAPARKKAAKRPVRPKPKGTLGGKRGSLTAEDAALARANAEAPQLGVSREGDAEE